MSEKMKKTDLKKSILIDAAISTICSKGLYKTKISDVVELAGLSAGMVNLHFKTKDNLLLAVLAHLLETQNEFWLAVAGDEDRPSNALLLDLCCVTFTFAKADKRLSSALMAYWVDEDWRTKYRELMTPYLEARLDLLSKLITIISKEGDYGNVEPRPIAHAVSYLADGLTMDGVIFKGSNPETTLRAVYLATLRGFFPSHFDSMGPISFEK